MRKFDNPVLPLVNIRGSPDEHEVLNHVLKRRALLDKKDTRKLLGYCFNPQHPRGRNKARVFASVGITQADAEQLRDAILSAARDAEAEPGVANVYGQRYIVDFDFVREERTVRIRSTWIVRSEDGLPRLTSCYVL